MEKIKNNKGKAYKDAKKNTSVGNRNTAYPLIDSAPDIERYNRALKLYNPAEIAIIENEIIAEVKKEKGWTLRKLSIKTGYSEGTLSDYLNGKNGVHDSLKSAVIARALDIDPVWLRREAILRSGEKQPRV